MLLILAYFKISFYLNVFSVFCNAMSALNIAIFKNKSKKQQSRILKKNVKKLIDIVGVEIATQDNSQNSDLLQNTIKPSCSHSDSEYVYNNHRNRNEKENDFIDDATDYDIDIDNHHTCTILPESTVDQNIESDIENDIISKQLKSNSFSINFLTTWSLKYNISHNSLTKILHWFKTNSDITNLPLDARTLLNTPKNA